MNATIHTSDQGLPHRAVEMGHVVDLLVPTLQRAGDAKSAEHEEDDPDEVQTDNGVMT